MNNSLSRTFSVKRGVPQGSVLAPPLFCVFFSDLCSASTKAATVKYADDLNVILPLPTDDQRCIQNAIEVETSHINNWCDLNGLQLNVAKSKALLITKNQICLPSLRIPQVKEMKTLGILLNERMDWNSHVNHICSITNQRFFALRRLKTMLPCHQLHAVYTALLRSLLEYASPSFVGMNSKLSKKLRSIDLRAHRLIYGIGYKEEYKPECGCSKDSIYLRRLQASRSLFDKICKRNAHILHCKLPPFSRRRFLLRFSRTSRRFNSFIPKMVSLFNEDV